MNFLKKLRWDTQTFVQSIGTICLSLLFTWFITKSGLSNRFVTIEEASSMCHWHTLLDRTTNAYFYWRTNPLFSFFHQCDAINFFWLFSTCLLTFGLLCCTSRSLRSCAIVLLSSITLTTLLVNDPFIFAAVAWLPLLTATLNAAHQDNSGKKITLLFLIAGGAVLSGNQLSIVVAGTACLLSYKLRPMQSHFGWLVALTLVPSLLLLILAPIPYFPDYPQGVQVIPDDDIPGMVRPYFGALSSVPVINRFAVRALYAAPTMVLLLCSISFLLALRWMDKRSPRSLTWIAALTAVFAFLDSVVPEVVSVNGPLAMLQRIIPHLFFFVLTPLALSLSWIVLTFTTLQNWSLSRAFSLMGCTVILIFLPHTPLPSMLLPYVSIPHHSQTNYDPLKGITVKPVGPALISVPYSDLTKVIVSPSYFLLSQVGTSVLSQRAQIDDAQFEKVTRRDGIISSSHNTEEIASVFTNKPDGRWTAGQAAQYGSEWVHLYFTHPQNIEGVELFLGQYVTDFPRGLRISALSQCDKPEIVSPRSFGSYKRVIEYPTWRGAIEFTEDGYPFYRGRFDVKAYFPEPELVQCLLLEQTATSQGSDWSISQIRTLKAN